MKTRHVTPTPEQHQAILKAIEYFGNAHVLSKRADIPYYLFYRWHLGLARVSPQYCPIIEKATKGYILRSQLRPDIFPPAEDELIKTLYQEDESKCL